MEYQAWRLYISSLITLCFDADLEPIKYLTTQLFHVLNRRDGLESLTGR